MHKNTTVIVHKIQSICNNNKSFNCFMIITVLSMLAIVSLYDGIIFILQK